MTGKTADIRIARIAAPHRTGLLGDLELESGAILRDVSLSYVTHGTLNEQRSNAVLVTTSIGGDHHRLDFLLGPSGAFDLEDWYVVAVDAIGNGWSTSPSTSTTQPGRAFPGFSIRDLVNSQYRFVTEILGLTSLAVVVGASMGGMQALQWAVSYPRFVRQVVALTPAARTSPWTRLVNQAARAALRPDADCKCERGSQEPEREWRNWITIMRGLFMRIPSAVNGSTGSDETDEWLEAQFRTFHARQDSTDWIAQSLAYDSHDVGATPGCRDYTDALRRIEARVLLVVPPLDLYNPVEEAEQAAVHIHDCRLVKLRTQNGHACTTGEDPADVANIVSEIKMFIDRP